MRLAVRTSAACSPVDTRNATAAPSGSSSALRFNLDMCVSSRQRCAPCHARARTPHRSRLVCARHRPPRHHTPATRTTNKRDSNNDVCRCVWRPLAGGGARVRLRRAARRARAPHRRAGGRAAAREQRPRALRHRLCARYMSYTVRPRQSRTAAVPRRSHFNTPSFAASACASRPMLAQSSARSSCACAAARAVSALCCARRRKRSKRPTLAVRVRRAVRRRIRCARGRCACAACARFARLTLFCSRRHSVS